MRSAAVRSPRPMSLSSFQSRVRPSLGRPSDGRSTRRRRAGGARCCVERDANTAEDNGPVGRPRRYRPPRATPSTPSSAADPPMSRVSACSDAYELSYCGDRAARRAWAGDIGASMSGRGRLRAAHPSPAGRHRVMALQPRTSAPHQPPPTGLDRPYRGDSLATGPARGVECGRTIREPAAALGSLWGMTAVIPSSLCRRRRSFVCSRTAPRSWRSCGRRCLQEHVWRQHEGL